MLWLSFLTIGALAGLLSGLLGIGGGIVLVPFLIWQFTQLGFPPDLIIHMAVATSLATIIATASSAVFAHQRLGNLCWSDVTRVAPFMFFGALFGAIVASHLPGNTLKTVFSVYLLIVAIRMGLGISPSLSQNKTSSVLLASIGTMIGALSSILGIGGGTLTVPFLTYCGYAMRYAVAISSACGIPIAIAGSIGYAFLTPQQQFPDNSLGYIYLPAFLGIIISSVLIAPLGAILAKHFPTLNLKRVFALLMLVIALKLLW